MNTDPTGAALSQHDRSASATSVAVNRTARRAAFIAVQYVNVLALAVILVVFTAIAPNFLTLDNVRDVLVQVAPLAVVAVPMTLVLISGYLDLSVGSVMALGAVTTGQLLVNNVPWPLACLGGLVVGAVAGSINGVAVSVFGWSTIIVTLGTLTVVRGVTLLVGPHPIFGFPDEFTSLSRSTVLGVPYLVALAILAFIAGWFVLNWTPFGRHVYAVGVNRRAAFLSGVRIRRTGYLVFLATGVAAALAGIMLASRLGSAPANDIGVGFEVDVLTAVLLGGVAFDGGRGSVVRVALGVLFLGVLSNGLILLNVSTAWSLTIRGLVLVAAAGLVFLESRMTQTAARRTT